MAAIEDFNYMGASVSLQVYELHPDSKLISFHSNGSSDPSALPLACPQAGMADSSMSEDCLSMVLYVPDSVNIGSGAPTLMWYVRNQVNQDPFLNSFTGFMVVHTSSAQPLALV